MAERNAFAAGAHTNRIRAEHCVHLNFVGRLVSRSCDLQIHSVCELDAQIVRCFVQECLQFFVIDRADIREAHAEFAVVGADQGRRDEGSVLIRNAHQRSGMEIDVESACRIGQDDGRHAHERHDADRQNDLLHGIALVKVHAAVHQDNRYILDIAKDILALMAFYR